MKNLETTYELNVKMFAVHSSYLSSLVTSIAVPFLMYVDGGFIKIIGLLGAVFPSSAMCSLLSKKEFSVNKYALIVL